MVVMHLCLETCYYVMFVKCLYPYLFLQMSPSHPNLMLSVKKFSYFHQQLMIAPRKSVFYGYSYEYMVVSLQASFSMLITLLFRVIFNFQSTKMILVFNVFCTFNLITLTYVKCYTYLSRNLTNYINQHKYFYYGSSIVFISVNSLKFLG